MFYNNREILIKETAHIKAQDSFTFTFNTAALPKHEVEKSRYKLRIRGDVDTPLPWKYEGGYPLLYRDIDDSLSKETHHSNFSLKINSAGEPYPRKAYYKILTPPMITPQFDVPASEDTQWKLSCHIKTEALSIEKNGRVGILVERFLKKEGRHPEDIRDTADEILFFSVEEGTRDWHLIEGIVTLDEDTACILLTVVVEHARGTVWFEDPQLKNETNFNILPQFTLSNQYHMHLNWLGENLSHKEWSKIQLTVNNIVLPTQLFFQRCYQGSENEVLLPDSVIQEGENTVTITNKSDYFQPYPFLLMQADLLWKPLHPVRIVSMPKTIAENQAFAALIETNYPNTTVVTTSSYKEVTPPEAITFEEAGLHALPFTTEGMATDIIITVSADEYTEKTTIERTVRRAYDNVLVGSGDAIYIPQNEQEMMEFFAWYLSNYLGNYITFRPVYRWSGSKYCNEAMWRKIAKLCNELHLYYCHVIDGRELPGWSANPTKEMLQGDYFVGNQGHERDGALYYWYQRKDHTNQQLVQEIMVRNQDHPDFTYLTPMLYKDDVYYNQFDPTYATNMAEGAEQFVRIAREGLGGIHRHSGPSVLFKYFLQAGLEIPVAELMYGPHEVIISAMRGAAIAYNRKEFGGHLAVQWSSTPHDTVEHYRRYQLALYVCYLHGVHHINTEEGHYRMEEYFSIHDRFDETCIEHGKVQSEFAQFVATHTRQGTMRNPLALLHGENDGWSCFGRRNVWAQQGDEWAFSTPEESWDLVQVFYPDSLLNAIYRHPCPVEPQGYYSRAPYGTVDILPIEATSETLQTYQTLAYLGYNTASVEQLAKITDFVKAGGTLLLAWPHLFTDTERSAILHGEPAVLPAEELTGVSLSGFRTLPTGLVVGDITLKGATVHTEINGTPVVTSHSVGKGKVLLVNTRHYPADPHVRPIYEKMLHELGEQSVATEQEKGWVSTTDTMETAAFDRPDGSRGLYTINTDWWSSTKDTSSGLLQLQGHTYPITATRGILHFTLVQDTIAIQTQDNATDIVSITPTSSGFILTVQGYGDAAVTIFAPVKNLQCKVSSVSIAAKNNAWSAQFSLKGLESIEFITE